MSILSNNNNNKSDLNNREKDLPGVSDYRPGKRQLRRKGNRGQFKTARTE